MDNILKALEKIITYHRTILCESLKINNITQLQFRIMEIFSETFRENRTITTAAYDLNSPKSTISDAVKDLIKKGFIQRDTGERDGRQSILCLSDKGVELIHNLNKLRSNVFNVLSKTGYEEEEIITKFLMELLSNIIQTEHLTEVKLCLSCRNLDYDKFPETEKPHQCSLTNMRFSYRDLKFDCEEHKIYFSKNVKHKKQKSKI
ncbi:MAG: winged helix DNA-binding protein [Candidatus Delongbacteria bacterium]|nr:winged helix DNA-binding protein [Candidatus Delongbacteria bacterium]MBN2835892.1 winged helix DNA-binding protein [Candidatus Delongbacteria bacterium]